MSKPIPDPTVFALFSLLDYTDWSSLIHAQGYATDTPVHLRALIGDVPELQKAALDHLSKCIMGRGMSWPVTAIAAEIVLLMLLSPTIKPKVLPIRDALEFFLIGVGTIGRLGWAMEKSKLNAKWDGDLKTVQRQYCESLNEVQRKLIKSKLITYSINACLEFVRKLDVDTFVGAEDRALIVKIVTGRHAIPDSVIPHSDMVLSNPDTLFSPKLNTPRDQSVLPLLTVAHPKQRVRKVLPSDEVEPPPAEV